MRAGIVTILDVENLGNRLQNYALQQVLSQYAQEVISITNKVKSDNALSDWKRSSALAGSVLLARLQGKKRKAKFLQFDKRYIRSTKNVYWHNRECTELKPKDRCDVYFAGSDQVWNPNLERDWPFNYLCFAPAEAACAYAPSFGIGEIPEQYIDNVRNGLTHIRYLSVREEAGKQIVENLTGRTDVQVLIDPTMLLDREDWDRVCRAPEEKLPENYLLAYFLGGINPERETEIRKKAAELGCEVVEVMDPEGPFYQIGPDEFLYLIRNARVVCTDSFHGSVFSFLWERPLVIFDREGANRDMGSRIETFVSKFHLQDCLARGNCLPQLPEKTDYSAGYAELETEREKSHQFLKTVFADAQNRTTAGV